MNNGGLAALRINRTRYERELYDERLKFEHELIHRRITWLLTSQSLLFAAYGFAYDSYRSAETFLKVTPLAGAAISLLILIGVLCGACAKRTCWKRFKKDNPKEQFGAVTLLTYFALGCDALLPVVFAGAWVYIYREVSVRMNKKNRVEIEPLK